MQVQMRTVACYADDSELFFYFVSEHESFCRAFASDWDIRNLRHEGLCPTRRRPSQVLRSIAQWSGRNDLHVQFLFLFQGLGLRVRLCS